MTKEQHQSFIEFALELKWSRDHYSRARIIEELIDKVDEIFKECNEPDFLDDDEDLDDECCDECGCYHGHHSWCGQSDEQDDEY